MSATAQVLQKFKEKIKEMKDELNCSICLELFKDPFIIPECAHLFCKQCLEDSTIDKENPLCPYCREPYKKPCPMKEISALTMKMKETLVAMNPVEHLLKSTGRSEADEKLIAE